MKTLCVSAIGLIAGVASAAPVDLTGWKVEGGRSNWEVAADKSSVLQSVNGAPTVFYNDRNSQGAALKGEISVRTGNDDDYIGFVLGYRSGDISRESGSDYLLIDWKQANQDVARAGLAISRVTAGISGEGYGPWAHDESLGVTELARGATLGDVGWEDYQSYAFELQFTSSRVRVFVDGKEEIDIAGDFRDGGFGFYNYSQSSVLYAGVTDEVLPPSPVPAPAALPLAAMAFGALFAMRRRG